MVHGHGKYRCFRKLPSCTHPVTDATAPTTRESPRCRVIARPPSSSRAPARASACAALAAVFTVRCLTHPVPGGSLLIRPSTTMPKKTRARQARGATGRVIRGRKRMSPLPGWSRGRASLTDMIRRSGRRGIDRAAAPDRSLHLPFSVTSGVKEVVVSRMAGRPGEESYPWRRSPAVPSGRCSAGPVEGLRQVARSSQVRPTVRSAAVSLPRRAGRREGLRGVASRFGSSGTRPPRS